ncbi:uncharacterized protein SPPG_05535 [Spizellomyces punctatus DAOM BR117]|uniref:J domain-containing protein n=1 Tax=Spizellomyces punctatus (strain DAOM BR117) TaxID=645134 RepID=A0A0L0HE38_SPIPD|nr:uncharacterized protein SPPG_05535 [Spizellomyces punctatus DAOM BR117]KNC99281.1 hypothetical protein SPPG_05535 [Spizellomyces punctatus DAOM BR117]|eukprot:XP_016607321.1 hypothetical protein SPPG_05535 [Spizellomyces punctatus DAOM BR117]
MTRTKTSKTAQGDDNDMDEPAIDLYAEFNISRDASEEQVKKAYRKLALKYHPDKLSKASEEEKAAATAKFQEIAVWYQVLSDPVKRKHYDQTGELGESDGFFGDKGDATWEEFFRQLWVGLTKESIEEFEKKYKGSEEERQEILEAYQSSKGDVFYILETVPLMTFDDLDRVREIVTAAISGGDVKAYKKFTKIDQKELAKRKRESEKEAREAEKLWQEIKGKYEDKEAKGPRRRGVASIEDEGEDGLRMLIQQRGQSRMDALVQNLEAKYAKKADTKGKKAGSKRKKRSMDDDGEENKDDISSNGGPELADEDFEAFQKKLFKEKAKVTTQESGAQRKVPTKGTTKRRKA